MLGGGWSEGYGRVQVTWSMGANNRSTVPLRHGEKKDILICIIFMCRVLCTL